MTRRRFPTVLAVAAASLAATVASSATTTAAATGARGAPGGPGGPGDRVVLESPLRGLIYENQARGFGALVGAPLTVESCFGDGFPTVRKVYHQRKDGTWTERIRARVPISVYRTEGPLPVLIGQLCDALVAGEEPQQPWAVGRAKVRSFFTRITEPAGPPLPGARGINKTVGKVRTESGKKFLVIGKSDVVLDENLVPIGDPADFQSLRVVRWRGYAR